MREKPSKDPIALMEVGAVVAVVNSIRLISVGMSYCRCTGVWAFLVAMD